MEENHRYTVAEVSNIESADGESAKFHFSFNGITYSGIFTFSSNDHKIEIGTRVFIKFSPINPDNSKVILDKVVPKNLIPPSKGWKVLP